MFDRQTVGRTQMTHEWGEMEQIGVKALATIFVYVLQMTNQTGLVLLPVSTGGTN